MELGQKSLNCYRDLLSVMPFLSQLDDSSHHIDGASSHRLLQFQEKADEAGVIVFVLSKAFAQSKTSQQHVSISTIEDFFFFFFKVWQVKSLSKNILLDGFWNSAKQPTFCAYVWVPYCCIPSLQVFYCEHRKRVIPLRSEDFYMPFWLSMLIGTGIMEVRIHKCNISTDSGAKESMCSLLIDSCIEQEVACWGGGGFWLLWVFGDWRFLKKFKLHGRHQIVLFWDRTQGLRAMSSFWLVKYKEHWIHHTKPVLGMMKRVTVGLQKRLVPWNQHDSLTLHIIKRFKLLGHWCVSFVLQESLCVFVLVGGSTEAETAQSRVCIHLGWDTFLWETLQGNMQVSRYNKSKKRNPRKLKSCCKETEILKTSKLHMYTSM